VSILDRLRDPSDDALTSLVSLIVDDAMGRPMGDVVDAERWPRLVAEIAGAWAGSDAAEERLVQAVLDGVDALDELDGVLGDLLPQSVVDGLRALMRRPYSPSRELVLRVIDQPPVRKLLREILMDAVTGFAKKARTASEASAVGGLASGLGRFAKRKAGTLGAIAGDMASAVGSEVERQVEKRASDFVDGALGQAIARMADQIADPARAEDQAALRTALLESALTLTGPELAAELRSSDPPALGRLARSSLSGWIRGDGFEEQIAGWLTDLVAAEGTRTLGETLDELALRGTVADVARELLLDHARHLVTTDAFGRWMAALENA